MGFLMPKAPSIPPSPPPPPPPPTPDDPAIEAQRKAVQAAERRRKGRAASVITGGAGVTEPALISQPALSAGEDTLGG